MIEARPYQLDALAAVKERRAQGITRQLISLPTGTGKTVVFSLLAKELNIKTLVVAHSEELINQAAAKFSVVWPGVSIGIVKAESDEVDAQVVIASIQTACREHRLQRLKMQSFGLLIIDEAHHAAAPSYTTLVHELGFLDDDLDKLLVGVTATVKRGDGVGLGSIFQEIVYDCSINTMIRAGYLAPLIGKQIFTQVELGGITIQNGDFAAGELARVVNTPSRNKLIVGKYKQFASERKKALAFCVDVQHAKDLTDAFNTSGIAAASIYGTMEKAERKQVLNDFSIGKYKVLTNCMILTEGFDEPATDCIILARPTKSGSLFKQMVGRGTRLHPLKRNTLILDFTDNAKKHDLCNYKNTLDGIVLPLLSQDEKNEDQEGEGLNQGQFIDSTEPDVLKILSDRIEDIEFFDKAAFAWTPVGDSWHLKLAASRDVWVRKVEGGYNIAAQNDGEVILLSSRPLPLDYALGISEDWARKQTTKSAWGRKDAAWRQESPTPKQLVTLKKLGFTVNSGLTKGQAAQLIDSKVSEPATIRQIYWLKHQGINVKEGITKFEAKKLIASHKKD